MTPFEEQFKALKELRANATAQPTFEQLSNGSHLIKIPEVEMPTGWDRQATTVLFVAPPGYPAARPDCFWVEPGKLRLENSGTPQATNDANPIPGDTVSRDVTWFSWHLQSWNPNTDTLVTYFNVILKRLNQVR